MISAEVILSSRSPEMKRITTLKLRYPKFIHGEFMTHRQFSRNASSSRAIPTAKLIEEVRSDVLRAGPVFWGANQKGMQAVEELSDICSPGEDFSKRRWAKNAWSAAAHDASIWAERLVELGVHKQIVNRILEPFSHINVVVTATEWDNFFGLRLDKAAQPEMRTLAQAIWLAMEAAPVQDLQLGDWHLPFINMEDKIATVEACDSIHAAEQMRIKISVARCARVSYESFETGKRSTVEEDLKLYNRLLGSQPIHASPAEHQATPDVYATDRQALDSYGGEGETLLIGWQHREEHGNFVGWRQYRKMIKGEAVAPLPEEYSPF